MFHPYLLRVMAQEKDTCALVLVGCFWLFNLENKKDLVLNGSRKQIGDKQVPGMYLHI